MKSVRRVLDYHCLVSLAHTVVTFEFFFCLTGKDQRELKDL
jgi:hypothetical protein